MTWDPDRYLGFEGHRLRPALDLLARIPDVGEGEVWDLGCGTGNVTTLLAERFAAASIHGLDDSAEMLAAAPYDAGIDWVLADIAGWDPPAPVHLVYSNAALHWLPDHQALFPRIARTLAPGGVLAVQMPRNFDEPTHVELKETALSPKWSDAVGHIPGPAPVHEPAAYLEWLRPEVGAIDIWETIYTQVLEGEDAVANWTRGTAGIPYLEALGERGDEFYAEYASALRDAHPMRADGTTVLPFRRLFIVATR